MEELLVMQLLGLGYAPRVVPNTYFAGQKSGGGRQPETTDIGGLVTML